MSKIDKLIQEYCPDGVKVKPIEAFAELKRGTSITKKLIKDGDVPVIAGGQKPAYYHNQSNRSGETIVVAGSGAYAGFVTFWTIPIFVSDAFTVTPDNDVVLTKFLFYFLKSKQSAIHDMKTGGGVPHVYTKDVAPILMPVPPLEVQKEIVNILDKFTQLEAELSAELSARRNQYEYYRNQLLAFGDERGVRWTTLQEVAMLKNGSDWKKLDPGNIPVYGTGGVMATVNKKAYDKPTVLIPRKGSITNIFYLEEPFWNVDTIYYTQIDETKIIPKFFYYYMKTIDLMKLDMGSGRPSLTQAILNKINVPIPSLAEQNRIIAILDNFDSLVNSISEGLPAELSARRKQYEYYRNKLLTFQELSA